MFGNLNPSVRLYLNIGMETDDALLLLRERRRCNGQAKYNQGEKREVLLFSARNL